MALKKSSKRRTLTVDMDGVESGGKIVPDGNYHAKIESIEETESKNENPMLVAKWRILSGKGKGGLVYDNISLTPQALWRLKGLLEALEIEVPDGSMDIDLGELEGAECTIQVTNESFEGRDRPKVTGYGSAGEEDSEDVAKEKEDDRVGKKPKKTVKKPSKDEEETKEDEDDEGEEFKEGQRVSFEDEKGKTLKGVVLEVDGDTVKVETKGGEEWEIDSSELTAL